MYIAHFGLREPPFALTPDPAYIYLSRHHREALAHLLYGTGENGGFVQLTGEVGTGKTTLVRALLEQGLERVDIALCLNPRLTVEELLATICDELHIEYPRNHQVLKPLVDALNAYLLRAHAAGRHTVLIIDEAQNLSREVLEEIRLLTNLETTKHKLLRIILVGQPELRHLLARADLRQLAQRITARYHLPPLDQKDTTAYIDYRLRVADRNGSLFTPSALRAVYRQSGGVPRLINIIFDRALLGAYSQGLAAVDAKIVRKAAQEAFQGPPKRLVGEARPARSQWALGFVLSGLILIGIGLWLPYVGRLSALPSNQAPVAATAAGPAPTAAAVPATAPPVAGSRSSVVIAKSPSPAPPLETLVGPILMSPPNAVLAVSAPGSAPAPNALSTPPGLEALQAAALPPLSPPEVAPAPPAIETPPQKELQSVALIPIDIRPLPALELAAKPDVPPPSTEQPPPTTPTNTAANLSDLLRQTTVDNANDRLLAAWGIAALPKSRTAFCERVKVHQLRCLAGQGTWDELRRFDRPVVLRLASRTGGTGPAVLLALTKDTATFDIAGQTMTMPLTELTLLWSGQYWLLWRPQTEQPIIGPGNTGSSVRWLRRRLALATGQPLPETVSDAFDASLAKLLRAYQQAQGLRPDGIAGGRTLVLLNNLEPAPDVPVLGHPSKMP
jgi:general secretion pathway protein A